LEWVESRFGKKQVFFLRMQNNIGEWQARLTLMVTEMPLTEQLWEYSTIMGSLTNDLPILCPYSTGKIFPVVLWIDPMLNCARGQNACLLWNWGR
jgi:hypothetical protein